VQIAIVKKERQLNSSLYTLLQTLFISVAEKNQLSCTLQPDQPFTKSSLNDNQLNLFQI